MRNISGTSLRIGKTQSCGCLAQEQLNATAAIRASTHGLAYTPEYAAWCGMRGRCRNPHHKSYPRYGGRGITICERWDDFVAFLADMGPRPSPKYSLDRIDNDGPYSPENCRWATRQQQTRNTSYNRRLTHDGKTMTIVEWAETLGIPAYIISSRLCESKWSAERALTAPYYPRK